MAPRTASPDPDPLAGFRGRPERDAYEAQEEEINAYRALASNDVNLPLLQDILRMDNLLEEMNRESSTLQRLVTHATERIGEACAFWVSNSDPASDDALKHHRNARAARLVLDWVDEQIRNGNAAEQQMMMEGEESD